MKINKSAVIIIFAILIIACSLLRVLGFAPQLAVGVFGAAIIKDKRLAFAIPLVSMFISDIIFEVLYHYGYSQYGGFYVGQLTNYALMAAVVFIGFYARNLKLQSIIIATLAAPTFYFLFSNFLIWINGAGFNRPKTFNGFLLCYQDAIPFFRAGLSNTIILSALFFSVYFLWQHYFVPKAYSKS